MAITVCQECKGQVSDSAQTCPHCGAKQKRSSSTWKWVLGVPVALLALMLIVGASVGDSEKSHQRDVISLCWKDHERKSFDPDTKRFIASTCENLEAQFQKKYGHSP